MLNQGYSYRHVLGPDALKQPIADYLARAFNHSSAGQWLERISQGEILLNGIPATPGDHLRPGQILVWNRPGWSEEPTPQSFDILYQDEHLVAVNKPGGLPTNPGAGFYQNTLLTLVRKQFPEARPLHRLGRATSGLVLFGLNQKAASLVLKEWPHLQKRYLALAQGTAPEDTYDIRTPIGEIFHPRLGTVHAAHPEGKPSRSLATVLQRGSDSTLFQVDIFTGRPHQIRIHLSSIGFPLVGDPLYAPGGIPKSDNPGLPGDPGYWLHAHRLVLNHPITGISLNLEAPPPAILRVS